jgi:hypothetical protein
MEKLEKEMAVLRAVRDRLVAADQMQGKRTLFPRHRHGTITTRPPGRFVVCRVLSSGLVGSSCAAGFDRYWRS